MRANHGITLGWSILVTIDHSDSLNRVWGGVMQVGKEIARMYVCTVYKYIHHGTVLEHGYKQYYPCTYIQTCICIHLVYLSSTELTVPV